MKCSPLKTGIPIPAQVFVTRSNGVNMSGMGGQYQRNIQTVRNTTKAKPYHIVMAPAPETTPAERNPTDFKGSPILRHLEPTYDTGQPLQLKYEARKIHGF